jgi:hypothetical protein
MDSWHSYPSIYVLGHKALENLFLDPVFCEEKVDGSQFSFGRFNNELKVRSKGKEMFPDAPEKIFQIAVDNVKQLDLHDGWTYRSEYLSKPKHNTIFYSKVPVKNIIIFDINTGNKQYLSYQQKIDEANKLGLQVVPLLFSGMITNPSTIHEFLQKESILGGSKIEGVVIKNYNQFGKDKKVLMGKYVSEAFKEVHMKEWKASNPSKEDVITNLITSLKTEARWQKAIQHLTEKELIENSPKDIGKLLIEIKEDIKKECKEDIQEVLYKWGIEHILRGCIAGFPEWYKKKLLESQFNNDKEI